MHSSVMEIHYSNQTLLAAEYIYFQKNMPKNGTISILIGKHSELK